MRLDHVALGGARFEEHLEMLTSGFGMELRRRGVRYSTGRPIAMLADEAGSKLELIDTDDVGLAFQHVAFRVDDVQASYDDLLAQGYTSVSEPHELPAAKAETALVESPVGVQVQLIRYEPDSPDL